MGMKLKSGADLCGFELSRFCVQNDVAIPDAPASGRKYFHTGTGMEGKYSLLGRERIYTGTAWRSAAYVDDLANLDLATNADYLALKEKVELLSGEVDTDAIINNMKEVTAFLSGFAEDANLMSVLDGKLNKSGGTIQGSGEAGTADTPLIVKSANRIYTAISLQTPEKEAINLRWYDQYGAILANSSASTWLVLGEDKSLYYTTDGAATKHILIHSGNIGSQSVAEAKNLVGVFSGGFDANECYNTYGHLRLHNGFSPDSANIPDTYNWSNGLLEIALNGNGQVAQFYFAHSRPLYYRASNTGAWKRIAFTDSDITGYAAGLKYSNGTVGAVVNSSGNVTIGGSDFAGTDYKLYIEGGVKVLRGLRTTNLAIECDENGGQTGYFSEINHVKGGNLYLQVRQGDLIFSHANGATTIRGTLSVAGNTTINNNLTVSNNIAANGTIACKGVAAEGSTPVGTVDKWAGSIAIGTKTQTYTHGLGTTDITVAIYEKNGNEWVQILTDVDIVNANTIRVTFGANTTVEHRIVVMG